MRLEVETTQAQDGKGWVIVRTNGSQIGLYGPYADKTRADKVAGVIMREFQKPAEQAP